MLGAVDELRLGISRTPQGVRGLKFFDHFLSVSRAMSHPARGAWIEMVFPSIISLGARSHPARGAWIEIR